MQNTLWRLFATTALIGSIGLPAPAQQIINLEEITFSANLTPTELGRSGSSVSVLTRQQIDRTGATSVSELLAGLAGVSITQTGPVGTTTDVRIRGIEPRFVSVYVDGVLINDPGSSTGAVDFGALQLGDVSRIEVLRGAQSALYGGSAAAGVVNITTLRPETDGTQQTATLLAGSFGTVVGQYSLRQRHGALDYALSLSHSRADGFSAADGQPEPDGHKQTRLSFSARYQVDNNWSAGASFFLQDSFVEFDDWLADAPHEQDRKEYGGRVFVEYATDRSRQTLEYTHYSVERELRDSLPGSFTGRRDRLAWNGQTDMTDTLRLLYGVDVQRETALGRTVPAGAKATSYGIFAQSEWAATSDLDIVLSGRMDRNSNYGSIPTLRVATSYRLGDALTLRASLGSGFRAPSVEQRFGMTGGAFPFMGNPGLDVERSQNYEIGADLSFANGGALSLTLFQIDTKNLIDDVYCVYDPVAMACAAGSFNSVVNAPGKARSRGVEFSFEQPVSDTLTLSANYTYTDAFLANQRRRSRVPRHDLQLGLDAMLSDRLQGRVSVRHVADRLDFLPNYTTGPLPDYTVANLSLRYQMTDRVDLIGKIDNLFNTQYQHVAGYGTSDRAFYLGFASRF
ncbi:MAG: TonB-dependent receptor [Rhodobacteraceae bacterium]|nr:TonB-dependent receptor [Paracoccaceae bacterium]